MLLFSRNPTSILYSSISPCIIFNLSHRHFRNFRSLRVSCVSGFRPKIQHDFNSKAQAAKFSHETKIALVTPKQRYFIARKTKNQRY